MANNRDDDDYEISSYRIPHNFNDSGKILGGMLSLRNLIEAAALGYLMYWLENIMFWESLGPKISIIIMLITIIPVVLMALIGINGDCLTKFIGSLFNFLRKRRKMRFRRIYNEKKEF